MADVVYFVRDLLFVSKIREVAEPLGVTVAAARTLDALEREAAAARLVVVDLRLAEATAALDRLARSTTQAGAVDTLGFVDHERVDLMETARALGCRRIVAKGQLAAELARLLAR